MKSLFRFFLPCILGLAATCKIAAKDSALLKSEFIMDSNPVPSCHATTIVELPTGGLVSAWFAGTAEGKPDVCIWTARSSDGSGWTAPVKVAEGTPHPCWNPVLFQPKEGPLMLFYKIGPSPSTWWGMLMTSVDGGQTWSQPQKLPSRILGPIKNKPVQLADGTIVCPTSTETNAKPSAWRVHFEITRDLGKTWTSVAPAAEPSVDAIQPSILFLGGDKLLSIGRSKHKKIFQVTSEDGGKSWGSMSLTSLPNPNSGTDAVTLADGRHLLIYNHTERGRSPLNLALSKDGLTWEAALVLENEPQREFSYPAIIQTKDGLVHVTYTWKRQLVKHAIIDPAKLQTQPIVNGVWPK